MTLITDSILPKLRRAIDDNEEPYAMADSLLIEYIEDAIDGIRLDWTHDYVVDREAHSIEPDVEQHHQVLFALRAKLDILERNSDITIRTNSVDVVQKDITKKNVKQKLQRAINNLIACECMGVAQDEFDDLDNYLRIGGLWYGYYEG
jgi:hypothetical protein